MRLFLIPISARRTLIYGQRLNKITHAVPSRADKVSAKAAELWLKWETAEEGWQKSVTVYGNKLFNRIPFEEWGLKSIPPLSARRQQQEISGKKIDIIYPPSLIPEQNVSKILHQLGTERNVIHRSRLTWSLIGMPIVAPFALVPVIPNLPFFYLAYRAFSHWKALAGGKHLNFLVENNLINPVGSPELDAVYARPGHPAAIDLDLLSREAKVAWTEARETDGSKDVLLLREDDARAIADVVTFPALAVECERAYRQVAEEMKLEAEKAA